MARPVTQEARRQDIVDATITLLQEADGAHVTIPDVARRLNLTPNAVRYYYRDADELLRAVRQRVDERFTVARRAAVNEHADPRRQLTRAMELGMPSGPDDAEWRATFRPIMSSRWSAEFGQMISEVFGAQAAVFQEILEAGATAGVFTLALPAADIARTLMLMEDYNGFRIVALDPQFTRADALLLMRNYAALVTGADLPVPA